MFDKLVQTTPCEGTLLVYNTEEEKFVFMYESVAFQDVTISACSTFIQEELLSYGIENFDLESCLIESDKGVKIYFIEA